MKDTFEWDMISDVDFDQTDHITFHTKHGKEVEFTKVIRCMDCKYWSAETEQTAVPNMHKCTWWRTIGTLPIDFCSRAERKPPQVNPEMVKALVDRIEKQRGEDAKRKS